MSGRLAGGSLLELLGSDVPGEHPDVIVENSAEGTIRPVRAVVSGQYKLVHARGLPDQLYDLDKDPRELHNLADDPAHAPVLARLRERLLADWNPQHAEAEIIASQRIRQFLGEAMAHGESTSWAFQPVSDAAHRWIRSTDDDPWDPLCGF